jgi:hypothetical protein
MKKHFASLLFVLLAIGVNGQVAQNKKNDESKTVAAGATVAFSATEQAKATLQAHGGDKFVNMKTLVIKGSADLTSSVSPQAIPAGFATVFAGVKFRMEIQSPFFNFSQIFDGEQSYSSIGTFSMPMDKAGFSLLRKIKEEGYTVSSLPEKMKKKKGFRVTSPEGYYTDFIVDEKTNQVKEYEASYQINGATLTTSVSIDKYREVNGVWINERYSQRLETPQGSFYASFKAKDISVDTEVSDDVFSIPRKN